MPEKTISSAKYEPGKNCNHKQTNQPINQKKNKQTHSQLFKISFQNTMHPTKATVILKIEEIWQTTDE